jgi:beta-lactam-binding protein with PASTA domain
VPLFRRRAARPAAPPAAPADPAATQPLEPVGAAYEVHEEVEGQQPPPPRLWPWLLALLVLVAAGLGALYALTRDDGDGVAAPPTETVTAGTVQVPDVEGEQLAEATAALVGAGLRARVIRRRTEGPEGVVLQQEPRAGVSVERGSAVALTVPAEGTIAVPDVRGMPAVRAFARLDDAGLKPRAKRVFAAAPTGEVVAQKPAPGTKVADGSTVVVNVSRGRREVAVPDVKGLPEAEAVAALEGAGLEVAVTRVPSDEVEGTVVAQSPAAGAEVVRGSGVQINVAARRTGTTAAAVTIPDVVGLTESAAARRLRAAGLEVETNPVESAEPAGRVVRQNPAAGTRRSRGAVVRIDVSEGTTVPDVVGEDEATATQRLEQAGFTVTVETVETTDPAEDGIVLEQRPSAGESLAGGGRVTIIVGALSG